MTASIYASRYKINHLIFGDKPGGQFVDAHVIENYPGFTSVDGLTLMAKFREHVESYGLKIREEKVGELRKVESGVGITEPVFEVKMESGEKILTKTLILTMGARHRALNVPGEEHFLGGGVSYCATCDAPLFKGKTVAVVGGGNSAVTAAIHVAEFADKVYILHRGEQFDKADPVWIDALNKKQNVEKIFGAQVKEIFGEKLVAGLKYKIKSTELQAEALAVQGVFVEIGLVPAISLANQIGVATDDLGYLLASGDLATNVAGVFAAGDLVKQADVPQLRQIVTSAGQGAIAAASVYSYLNQKKPAPDWG